MTAESIQDPTIELKNALVERTLSGVLSCDLGLNPAAIRCPRPAITAIAAPEIQDVLRMGHCGLGCIATGRVACAVADYGARAALLRI